MGTAKLKIIRSDGQQFNIDYDVWGLTSLAGFDSPNIEVFSEKRAFGDGSIITGQRIGEAERSFTARLIHTNSKVIERAKAIKFFNPKYSYDLYVTYQGVTKWCSANLLGRTIPTNNENRELTLKCTFLSEMPYLKSVDDFGKDIAAITPSFMFPYLSDISHGFNFSRIEQNKTVTINYDGDVPSQFKCVIEAKGEVINPKIKKGDKYVRILDTLQSGDKYIIDFVQSPPRIEKNGVAAFNMLDRGSSLVDMDLQIGSNVISYEADSGDLLLSVTIFYNELYLGV